MRLHHCGLVTHRIQDTVIVSLVPRLDPHDGEGSFVSRHGARGVNRDTREAVVSAVNNISGSLAWGLLEPAGVVTASD